MEETSGRPKRLAHVNLGSRRAVVYEIDGTDWLVEISNVGEDVPARIAERGLHIGMWVQPAMSDLVAVDECAPYTALRQRMRSHLALDNLVRDFATVIDPSYEEFRQSAAVHFEQWLGRADEATVARFREIVVGTPFPLGASTRDAPFVGRGAEIFAEVIASQGICPPSSGATGS